MKEEILNEEKTFICREGKTEIRSIILNADIILLPVSLLDLIGCWCVVLEQQVQMTVPVKLYSLSL